MAYTAPGEPPKSARSNNVFSGMRLPSLRERDLSNANTSTVIRLILIRYPIIRFIGLKEKEEFMNYCLYHFDDICGLRLRVGSSLPVLCPDGGFFEIQYLR